MFRYRAMLHQNHDWIITKPFSGKMRAGHLPILLPRVLTPLTPQKIQACSYFLTYYFYNIKHKIMAETVGFEPTRRFPAYTLSRRAPSTTRPRLPKLALIYLYQVYKRDKVLCRLNQQNEYLHACFVCPSFQFFQSALTQSLRY